MPFSPKKDLIKNLIAIGAVKFGDFNLSSGQKSKYYVDLKLGLCLPKTLANVSRDLVDLVPEGMYFDRWAGVELGAVPLAVACALESSDPYLIVRKTPKGHGTQNLIEGPYTEGQTVVLVEDVVTTGGSSLKAVKALQDARLFVLMVLAVVDRQQGGAETFHNANIPFFSLLTGEEILEATK